MSTTVKQIEKSQEFNQWILDIKAENDKRYNVDPNRPTVARYANGLVEQEQRKN